MPHSSSDCPPTALVYARISILAVAALSALAFLAPIGMSQPIELPLIEFSESLDRARLRATADAGAVMSPVGPGGTLRVYTGHEASWPGVTLKPPGAFWDLSGYEEVVMEVRNLETNRVTVACRVDHPGADGTTKSVTDQLRLEPGQQGSLRVGLKRTGDDTLDGKLFGMRGYPVRAGGPKTIDPSRVSQLLVFANKPTSNQQFEISRVRAQGPYVAPTAWVSDAEPFLPFIDTFGQYKHKDWPGKVHSVGELKERRESEAKELLDHRSPPGWDQYGGWADGPQLKATGFFRTEKLRDKWWLVDPEGHLFFSHGIDCVRMRDVTPIEERDAWFEDCPGNDPALAAFVVPGAHALKGHYAGRNPRSFAFGEANLFRKYGPEWSQLCGDLIHRRLRSWGLNTIGMWSHAGLFPAHRTPYVDSLGVRGVRMIQGSEGYWGKFPDVWDPAYRERLREAMSGKVGRSAGDPWCLGYFADNEMSWGDETSLARGTLSSSADQPAKQMFLADLKAKYADIGRLNAAWGTAHSSWEAFSASTNAPEVAKARDDLVAFYHKTAEEYFRTVRTAIKERAPSQLYLGCRFAWVNPVAAAAAAKFCDVVSYNLYRRQVADFQFNGGSDVPLIIGEFHFGALDRGMFHTGLVPVRDQTARAAAYRNYVEGALRHPAFVGCHWFQYQDEPTTGRVYDEENYQIGFVDIADTPYPETVEACRTLARTLYQIRFGK